MVVWAHYVPEYVPIARELKSSIEFFGGSKMSLPKKLPKDLERE